MKALGSSRHRADAAGIAQVSGEATPSLTGSGRTEYERRLDSLFMRPLARWLPRRERSLGAVCWPHGRQRHGAVLRTSAVSGISRMSGRSRVARARSRLRARRSLTGSAHVATLGGVVRAPMQKFCFHVSPVLPRLSPNHAMERTATRLAFTRCVTTFLLVLSALALGRRRSSWSR